MAEFYSNGKLLLTSEYAVLDGAKALAVPTKFGQSLKVKSRNNKHLTWRSFDHNGALWFEANFKEAQNTLEVLSTSDTEIAQRLIQVLDSAVQLSLNPPCLNDQIIETHLDFDRNWGLGTSSTLINNLANWFQINPYNLLQATFGGSGYDIACAQLNQPLVYELSSTGPLAIAIDLQWDFKDHLYFVYLNQKQNSRLGIANYRSRNRITPKDVERLNSITAALISANKMKDFEALIHEHNTIIGHLIGQEPLGQTVFSDFKGSIKNLGAWGGDFILVSSKTNPSTYFRSKGFGVVLPFSAMVK